MIKLSSKKATEAVTVSVDFALLTPTPATPEFIVKHLRGVADPTPAAMLTTAPFVTGTVVSCLISGGVVGATYVIEVWVNSGTQHLCEELEMTVTA